MMKANFPRRARLLMVAISTLVWTGGLPSGSAAQAGAQPVVVGGACEHARYKQLLQTPFSNMGDREHDYFLALDQACRDHKRALAGTIAASTAAYNACAHPPYANLAAAKAPADMTQREYQYFLVADRECAAYKQAQQQQPQPQARQSVRHSAGRQFFMGLLVLGSIVVTLIAGVD